MRRHIFISLILTFFAVINLNAQQTVVIEKEMDRFSSVCMSDKFTFRIKNSSYYFVKIIADERIADFVRPVVKNGTLSVHLDEKKYPSELKKQLKAKGAATPVLEIEIHAPALDAIELKDKVVLQDSDRIKAGNFSLKVAGNAMVSRLFVDCVTADILLKGSSNSNISVDVDTKLKVAAENTASASIVQNGGNAIVNMKGGCSLNLGVRVVDVDMEVAGNATTYISGVADGINVESAGYSVIDAEALEVKDGNFVMSGSSRCYANVEELMKVNLTGGSMLTFKRKPVIEVERIVNSTLIKYDDPKRK